MNTETPIMKKRRVATMFGGFGVALLFASVVIPAAAQTPAHVMENLSTAKWGPAPPLLPAGAQIAVLAGDPTRAGLYTVRLKFPANYDIPAHSHPTDENVLVISGKLFAGMGTKLDRKAGMGLDVGGFALMPANANHFAYTEGETTILLYGRGPVEFTYVNPADDPRAKASTSHQ
ncbi:MAG: cupin domain-containing protein, partial [Acidobacteriota bacterium]